MEFKISELIYKSISKSITADEEIFLKRWLVEPKNKKLYDKIIDSDYLKTKLSEYQQIDTKKAYHNFNHKIKKSRKPNYINYIKYAAIFIGIVSLGYIFQQSNFSKEPENVLKIADEDIILKLNNGLRKTIDEEVSSEIIDKTGDFLAQQTGDKLIYNNQSNDEKEVFHTLIVPYGKKFQLVLSDGTKVHLNAGSSLKYPVNFIANKNRQVYLKGEAFFEVSKNLENPFIVNANNLGVKVYGTKFNVSAYEEDVTTDVVLVEGSVGLYATGNYYSDTVEDIILSPGHKGFYDKQNKQILTAKVKTYLYTAWINGELLYRDIPFKKIIPKLERHFNVSIINKNTELDKELFYASFKEESIETILNYFNETHQLEYKIINNQIIIK